MPVVTVIGDGQLARMMQTAAIELGQSVRLLAGSRDSSAAQVAADVVIGDYTDYDDLVAAAQTADVVTFDHEHVPTGHLQHMVAEGINVQPGPAALVHAQDKLVMRQAMVRLGAPVPDFAPITSAREAEDFWHRVDGDVCLKAVRGGYDGKGVWFPDTLDELTAITVEALDRGTPLMGERKVHLVRELSAMVARSTTGETKAWPIVESVQTDGICTEAVAPAPNLSAELAQAAQHIAMTVATGLGVTGAMAVELFETLDDDGKTVLFVNELAMRPHNTGHWSQDGCVTDQFEQHIHAVLGSPLGSTKTVARFTCMVNVLGAEKDPTLPMHDRMVACWQRFPGAKIHLYGKGWRPGRKIGHVNMTTDSEDVDALRVRTRLAAGMLMRGVWDDGWQPGALVVT